MEFGSRQCKPQSPVCSKCPLNIGCQAYATGSIKSLPVKLKKTKITKKYFNFIVTLSGDNKTQIEQRTKKGIWQQLYQFPLIETETSVALEDLLKRPDVHSIIPKLYKELFLYNETEIIHKLSHQELHIKFWILKISSPIKNAIKWSEIKSYPVPIVIERFINNFQN